MKLRQSVDDFKVEEITDLKISKTHGNYKTYLLKKRGLETFALLAYLSKKNKIPIKNFGIAGLKDRHAVTAQYFTIPSEYEITTLQERNFTINFMGYLTKALELGGHIANNFEITVRDLKKSELSGIEERARTIEILGVPNYFDSQRFGSVIHNEFIAKHFIKKEYERAVKLFLTGYTKKERSAIKAEKKEILANWPNIKDIMAKDKRFAKVIEDYRMTDNWRSAYLKIPYKLLEMFMSAYRSYLWNECIKTVMLDEIEHKKLYAVRYELGELLFYDWNAIAELKNVPITFKTISHKLEPSAYELHILKDILLKEGLSLDDFKLEPECGYDSKVYDRTVLVKPYEFKSTSPGLDELNTKGTNEKYKITFTFKLPKGSYATIITKKILKK